MILSHGLGIIVIKKIGGSLILNQDKWLELRRPLSRREVTTVPHVTTTVCILAANSTTCSLNQNYITQSLDGIISLRQQSFAFIEIRDRSLDGGTIRYGFREFSVCSPTSMTT